MRPSPIATLVLAACAVAAGPPAGTKPTPIAIAVPSRKEPVSYAKDVAEVLAEKCVGCHSEALAENKLCLEEVAGMFKGGKRGPAIVAGKAGQSLLFQVAAHRVEPVMPPKDKKDQMPLTPEELGLLERWIDAGAKDDSAENAAPAKPIELGSLPPGLHPIVAVDMTSDGSRIAFGQANLVRVVDADSGREIVSLGGHKDIVQSLRFSPDGKTLAAGGFQTVTLWHAPMGGIDRSLTGPTAPGRSGKNAGTWSEPRTLGPHTGRVLALDFSPDGKLLAAGGGEPSRSGEIRIWNVATGQPVRTLDAIHSDTVFGLRFSPDGTRLASAGADKFMRVTRVADGKELKAFEGHTQHVMGVDWKSDGKQIVTAGADGVLKVWDADSGDQLRTLLGAGKQVTAVRWVPGKPLIAGGSGDRVVRFWDPESGGVVRTLSGPGDYIFGVATSRDGTRVAAGGADGVLFLWNGTTGQLLRKIEPPVKPEASR
jgi:WD40 repeat protein